MTFWQKHPVLYLGLFVYLATFVAFAPSMWLFMPIVALVASCRQKKLHLIGFSIALCAYLWTIFSVQYPPCDEEYVSGRAKVEVLDITQKICHGVPYLKMKLRLYELGKNVKNITCSMRCKSLSERPYGGFVYDVEGTLQRVDRDRYEFCFMPKRGSAWIQKGVTFSFVEWRYEAKLAAKRFLRAHLEPGQSRTFLEGLILGDFQDLHLSSSLRRLGLMHIMVVSGFHFSLIAAFLAFLMRVVRSWKWRVVGLFLGTSMYLLFLGSTASVLRAWVAVVVVLAGKFFERKTSGLNALGVALVCLLFYEPTFCLHLGFQLSFLATGAILLFYPLVDAFFVQVIPKRSMNDVLAMSRGDQLGSFLLVFFRKAFALSCAVNILMIPMTLYAFQTFPGISIFYNCFSPFFVSICLFLLCLACLFAWVPFVGCALFSLCNLLTELSLTFVTELPTTLEMKVSVQELPAWCVGMYLVLAIFGAVWLYEKKGVKENALAITI